MSKFRIAVAAIAAAVTVSVGGLSLISRHEGVTYTAYADPAHGWKVATICHGHTKGVYRGMTATKAQCDRWLKEDVAEATQAVLRLVKVPLTQGELDAYVSFVFNAGAGNFARSTLLRLLNAGRRVEACNQLLRWTQAGGRVFAGLVTRRTEERALCLSTL